MIRQPRLFHSISSMFRRSLPCVALAVTAVSLTLAACDAWVSTATRVERARMHLSEANYRAAMTDLKTVLVSEPEHVAARILLAELSLQLGDFESAEKEIDRALASGASAEQVNPIRYEVLLARGRFPDLQALLDEDTTTAPAQRLLLKAKLQSAAGNPAAAEQTLQAALEQAPGEPELLLELARVRAARGDTKQAMELPELVSQSRPVYARALMLRASVLMSRGMFRQARNALLQVQEIGRKDLRVPEKLNVATYLTEAHLALGDVESAGKSLRMLDLWAPDAATTRYLHARIAILTNDPATAVTECQKALRADPQHVQAQLLLAAAHLAQGSLEQAEEALERWLAASQDNIAARKLLAQVYLARGQPAKARGVLSAVAAGTETDPQVDWLIGSALLQSGSSASALQHLERSVSALPDSAERRIELASAYISARMPDKAVAILSSIPPDAPAAPRAKALLVLATAAGKPPVEARREIEKLVASHKDDVNLWSAAGAFLAAGSDIQASRSLLERAIALDPKGIGARVTLARVLTRLKDFGGAEAQLKEVLRIDPNHQMARIGLSELAWAKGDRDSSRKWLEEAISVKPVAVEARLRLAQIAFIEGDANRGRDLLNQAISVGEDRGLALNGAGKILARVGLSSDAQAKFQEAAAAGLPEGELNSARLSLELGRPDEARRILEGALARNPYWREAEQLLIQVEARTGQVDRAIARARSLAVGASAAVLRELEGDVYATAGKAEAAIAAYEDAQRQQPSSAVAVKLFGARRHVGAVPVERSLTEWLRRSPEDTEVRRLLATYYEASGRRDDAIAEYERLVAERYPDPIVLNNLAWLLHDQDGARALDLARRAYAAAPKIPEIADTYGWILVQTDNTAEGLRVLEMALAGAPGNADIQYHVAAAFAKSGQPAKAAELLKESLKSERPFESREAATGLLRSVAEQGP